MNYDDVILGRRSIRGYLDKPVPRELIEEVLALASRSPSSMNTQPWHFHVITGEPLDRIRKGNTERILAGEPD
ncbi:MAG: nitroreductase family protein, partial [Pontixanthobacter sp.]